MADSCAAGTEAGLDPPLDPSQRLRLGKLLRRLEGDVALAGGRALVSLKEGSLCEGNSAA